MATAKKKRWRCGEMRRDRPVSRREGKGECNNEGERAKNRALLLLFFLFSFL